MPKAACAESIWCGIQNRELIPEAAFPLTGLLCQPWNDGGDAGIFCQPWHECIGKPDG